MIPFACAKTIKRFNNTLLNVYVVQCSNFCENLPELRPFVHHLLSGNPVHTLDQQMIIASQSDSVLILGKNLAAENRIVSSTISSTGLPSRYISLIYARALSLTFSWPIETRNRNGAFLIL